MKKIIIDGYEMTSTEKVYNFLKNELNFSSCCKNDMESLWSMLTKVTEPVEIYLINKGKFKKRLRADADKFIDIFIRAHNEYGFIKLKIN